MPASLMKLFAVKQLDIEPVVANLTNLAPDEGTPTPATERSDKMTRSSWEKITAIQQLLQATDKTRRKSEVTATEAKMILDNWKKLNIENQYPVDLLLAVVAIAMVGIVMAYILFSKGS